MRKSMFLSVGLITVLLAGLFAPAQARLHPIFSDKAVIDTVPFYVGAQYDPAVPAPNDYLAQPLGKWPAGYDEAVAFLKALAQHSDRVILEERGTTHEGRTLYNVYLSTPENISNLESYRPVMDKVADPRVLTSETELDSLINELPAFAWLGYTIHGDELMGTDAALQLIYHLAAANDSATMHLLKNLVIIIDPMENPDGRERYRHMLQIYQSSVPNYDNQSMQHEGVWPWGRTNHYWFDLNRDCILVSQPETEGKVRTILKWHPVLVVDAHGMGSNATYLFSPPREPINYNTPANVLKWYKIFSKDQAAAFDARGWTYYTGEWNEQWYPGYTSAWPTFLGAVGILYEQARVDGVLVKQRDGYILTFHEAVNHQFTSSLANLTTAANHRTELLRDYYHARRKIIDRGKKERLRFLFVPDKDEIKMRKFIHSLLAQGIEVERATKEFTVGKAVDIYHTEHSSKTFPAGTYIVNTAQPNGALARAVLDFDPHLKKEFLEEERRELEKHGDSRLYEVTAWSVPLAYNLDAYMTRSSFSAPTEQVDSVVLSDGEVHNPEAQFGFLIDMVGEKTYVALGRLFAEELIVYCAKKPFTVEDRSYQAGTLFLRKRGNPENLPQILENIAKEVGIDIYGINTGYSTEGSLLGAPSFRLLVQPRIAIVAGDGMNYTSVGSLWYTIDKELRLPHSLLPITDFGGRDLSKYNVLVFPSAWGPLKAIIGKGGKEKLERWVSEGGTLILIGQSATWAADTSQALSQARLKRQVLDKLEMYRKKLEREIRAESPSVDTMELWYPEKVPPKEAKENEQGKKPDGKMSDKEKEELDRWQRRFFPRGAILRAEVDQENWLAFGMKASLPVMCYTRSALMAAEPVKTVARYSPDETKLRLAGLLWPEARRRWAGTACITREQKGAGQIILFATPPNFRDYFWGSRQMFVNALLYGPGMTHVSAPYEKLGH